MKKLLVLLSIIVILSSCVWGKGAWWEQQKPKKVYYGLGSGRQVGHR